MTALPSRSDPIDLLRRIGGSIMDSSIDNPDVVDAMYDEITDLLTDVDLGRRTPKEDAVRTELEVLRVAAHGHVQVIRGMCSDMLDHREIDRALVRLDDVINPERKPDEH